MSIPEYKDGKYIASWDFECPLCGAMWDNDGDPYGEGDQEEVECPKCEAILLVTASYSVDYEIEVKTPGKVADVVSDKAERDSGREII